MGLLFGWSERRRTDLAYCMRIPWLLLILVAGHTDCLYPTSVDTLQLVIHHVTMARRRHAWPVCLVGECCGGSLQVSLHTQSCRKLAASDAYKRLHQEVAETATNNVKTLCRAYRDLLQQHIIFMILEVHMQN